jgi:hypothetical protein
VLAFSSRSSLGWLPSNAKLSQFFDFRFRFSVGFHSYHGFHVLSVSSGFRFEQRNWKAKFCGVLLIRILAPPPNKSHGISLVPDD